MFGLKPKPLTEDENATMENLWNHFERKILWPEQKREDDRHPPGCTMFTCKHPWNPLDRTKLDEIYLWEDFARANYGTPVEEIAWT